MEKIKKIVCSLIITIILTINFKAIYPVIKVKEIFSLPVITISLLFIVIYYLFSKFKDSKLHVLKKILAALFSILMVVGNSFKLDNSFSYVLGNMFTIVISILSLYGYYLIFTWLFKCLDIFLKKKYKEKDPKSNFLKKIKKFITEKPFISSFLIIILFWSIYVIAFYPTIMSFDPSYQIVQYKQIPNKYDDYSNLIDKNQHITNHHPVVHTLFLGSTLELGSYLVNDNFGLFLISLIQIVILASALAYTIKIMSKYGAKFREIFIVLLIYALVPMFPFFAMSPVKDTLYTAFIILFVCKLFDLIKSGKEEQLSLMNYLSYFLLSILIILCRNNGLYVILFTLPFVIFYNKKNRLLMSILLLSVVIFNYGYNNVVLPHFKITNGSVREALSIPFQQTARLVKKDPGSVSKKDKEIIDKVLGYDDLALRYDPEFADPVKNNFNKDTTDKELKAYFGVWFKGLTKRPDIYIESTINNVFGYFYPNDLKWYYYSKYNTVINEQAGVDYSYNGLSGLREGLAGYASAFPYIPIVGLISNIGFNTFMMLTVSVYLIVSKKSKYLICMIPLFTTLLICVASPVNTYFRYAMPYVFLMPFICAMTYNVIRKKEVK